MEYHSPQLQDHSLILEVDGRWVAIFPGHQVAKKIYSHKGLTFGGWIVANNTTIEVLEGIIVVTLSYFINEGFTGLEIKSYFYPSNTFKVDFEKYGFAKISSKPGYFINLPIQKFPKSKLQGVKKAENAGVYLERDGQFEPFWELLTSVYEKKLSILPVHTLSEIKKLAIQHPILQYNVYQQNSLLAGATLYAFDDIIRTQYLAVSEAGKALGAMDYLMFHLTESKVKLLDLGGVTDPRTDQPSESLVWWKKSFGAQEYESEVWTIQF